MPPASHKSYFASVPAAARKELNAIARAVQKLVPTAEPCISYGMPAYRDGKVFFYFAAFKRHIGIYPPVRADRRLIKECAAFRGPKGNLSFPLDRPIPMELIGRVALVLHREYTGKSSKP